MVSFLWCHFGVSTNGKLFFRLALFPNQEATANSPEAFSSKHKAPAPSQYRYGAFFPPSLPLLRI